MRYLLSLFLLIAWGLWFGGTISLFFFATSLFRTHHTIAGEANSAMFVVFGWAQLIPAGFAIAAAGLLLILCSDRRMILMLACLILAAALAMTSGLGITPRMESLRQQGLSKTDEFKKMHGESMVLMLSESILLLGGGMILSKRPPLAEITRASL